MTTGLIVRGLIAAAIPLLPVIMLLLRAESGWRPLVAVVAGVGVAVFGAYVDYTSGRAFIDYGPEVEAQLTAHRRRYVPLFWALCLAYVVSLVIWFVT